MVTHPSQECAKPASPRRTAGRLQASDDASAREPLDQSRRDAGLGHHVVGVCSEAGGRHIRGRTERSGTDVVVRERLGRRLDQGDTGVMPEAL